jgi:hypothetical protein
MERNYYLIGGYDFEINRDFTLSPSTLMLKFAENGKFQADITMQKSITSRTIGGDLLTEPDMHLLLMAGVSIDKLIFGYAFDIGLNSVHELLLRNP